MRQTPTVSRTPASLESQVPTPGQKCLAEVIGTAFLVYIGCGALTASAFFLHGKAIFAMADLLGVALAFGVALAVMIYALGHISNCHINPAVSIAMACIKRMSWSDAGMYIIAQLVGAILGALLVAVTFGASAAGPLGYGATDYNATFVNYFGAIVVEAIGTFFLVFVITAMTQDKRAYAAWGGFASGLTLTLGILVAGAVTGGALNPARAFGPAIVQMLFGSSYPFGHLFVYFIGPIIGGVLGAFTYEYIAGLRAGEHARYRDVEPGY